MREGCLQRHVRATRGAVVVVWLPVADADRSAADGRVWCHPPLNRRRVDEWFEAGTGLTISLNRVVEFVGVEVVAADHRDDLAGLGVERHHRALHRWNLRKLDFPTAI